MASIRRQYSRRPSAFRRDRRGVVAVVTALCITALIGMAALALDVGLAYSRRSALQGATDMAALSATYNLSGADGSVINALAGNGFSTGATHTTVTGNYSGLATTAPSSRFVANATPLNAVQVTAYSTSAVIFGNIFNTNSTFALAATATATRLDLAGLTAGTTLASANTNASVLNGLLGGLLGTSVNLSAVSYQNLIGASVTAAQFFPALATQLGLSAGATYGQLASANVTMGQIVNAEIAALAAAGTTSGAAVTALGGLLSAAPNVSFPLASLINVSAWQNEQITGTPIASALQAQIGLFTLLMDTAQIVSGGGKVITLNPTVSGLGVSVQLVIGAPAQSTPYYSFSPVGASVHTAQVRLMITIQLGQSLLGGQLVTITLPVYIEAASGTATLTAIACGANPKTDATVTVLGTTGLGIAWVGSVSQAAMTNFTTEPTVSAATLATAANLLPLVTGSSGPDTFLSGSSTKVFTQTMIQATPPTSQQYTSTNVSSLTSALGNTHLTINLGILGLTTTTAAVQALLQPGFNALDGIVATLLNSLGIGIGEMDVTVNGVRCGVPVLVQ